MIIPTARLVLIPATVEHVRAEISDPSGFALLLAAEVPKNWPPESTVDAIPLFLSWLEAAPECVGWYGWYAILQESTNTKTLIGGGGFLGPPQDGTVMMGYSVLPQYQKQGYATELVQALVRWVLVQPGVERIIAETEHANPASVRVLHKAGFVEAGTASEPGGMRFELSHRMP